MALMGHSHGSAPGQGKVKPVLESAYPVRVALFWRKAPKEQARGPWQTMLARPEPRVIAENWQLDCVPQKRPTWPVEAVNCMLWHAPLSGDPRQVRSSDPMLTFT